MEGTAIPQLAPSDLAYLMARWRFFNYPITVADWIASLTGTGTTASSIETMLMMDTGATGGSQALAYLRLRGLALGGAISSVNYDKAMKLVADFDLAGNDAGANHRIHLKNTVTAADMTTCGLGIKAIQYALWGESFGTALGLVNLNYSHAINTFDRVEIVHIPGVRVEWWINGSLKGTQTDTTKIPSGSVQGYISLSSKNVANVSCYSRIVNLQLLQEL